MTKALLIIDIQNDYFENGKMELVGSEKAIQNAKTILEFLEIKIQVSSMYIVVVPNRDLFSPDAKVLK
jgi:translation initiation factor 2 gamma subunit (eIF-2gamma)